MRTWCSTYQIGGTGGQGCQSQGGEGQIEKVFNRFPEQVGADSEGFRGGA